MARQGFIAFDLGAESGRAMLAVLEKDRLELHEAHRFPNRMLLLPDGWHWDLTGLWANLMEGLKNAARMAATLPGPGPVELISLGVDTWGVDFGLVGASGQLLGLPFVYRDPRNVPAMKATRRKLGDKRIYGATGIQFMSFNTIYQLAAQRATEPGPLKLAEHILFTPDLLHYFFSGKAVNEATIASTAQLVDPFSGKWATGLIKALGVPTRMFGRIVPAGTRIGRLRQELAAEAGLQRLEVIAPGGHDTASAVAAVPVQPEVRAGGRWAYISSGTWSLMGAELDAPIVTEAARRAGFTNERGVEGKIRFLKNIMGLWLVQETRRDFARQGKELDYPTLMEMAGKSEPFRTLIDPDRQDFMAPGGMCARIADFARHTGQPVPQTPGQFVRCCLDSLALAYRRTVDNLEKLLGHPIEVLHIVGGGGKNALLNQMTADALDRTVIVGPFEATAIGNALTQAIGARAVRNLDHLRAIVRASFDPLTVRPKDPAPFAARREQFESLVVRR